ncbi:hypothetical protein ACU4IU_09555 [Brevibacterium sp. CSND-B09]|uniref:hypothetical protein n=1 Tax=Brevibacterium sp. CSND-B09 TaxID=3462571 RepID=UPI00406A7F3F
MPAEVRVAVAGSGKTAEIASRILAEQAGTRSASITFTTNGQNEISSRLPRLLASEHETMGWFAFLVRHIIRPYLPKLHPGFVATGLCFVQSDAEIPKNRSGWKYYLNDHHQPYSTRLGTLAKKVMQATSNAPIRRLERIYNNLYFDEIQDLGGNDLVILEALMKSSINLFVTGDVRQAVLTTSRSDRANRSYRGVQVMHWFREKNDAGVCDLTFNETTTRFNQAIASFSDLIHDPALELPATTSTQTEETGHDGVFLVDDSDLSLYVTAWDTSPTILWARSSQRKLPKSELLTFGGSKGLTRDRVVIVATSTGPICKWLKKRELLTPSTACGFYVAATRARYSVALVTKNAARLYGQLHQDFAGQVSLWTPK